MNEFERLGKRIGDKLRLLTKDMNKLLVAVEERGLIIDALAREKEQLEAENKYLLDTIRRIDCDT